jgi:hypothetical protein
MAGYFGLRIVNPSRFAHFCAPCAPNRENEAKVVFYLALQGKILPPVAHKEQHKKVRSEN